MVVVVVLTLNNNFYAASSAHPVSVLIPYPREIRVLIMWSQTERQRKTKNENYQVPGKSQIQVSSK